MCPDDLRAVALGLLVIGGVVLGISIVGCIGTAGENRFLLLVVSLRTDAAFRNRGNY